MKTKTLVIAPAWLGDVIMSQTLLMLLKDQGQCIDVVASSSLKPLLECMPEVNKIIPCDIQHGEFNLKKRYQVAQMCKLEKYDHAFVLPNSWKSALIPFLAGIPKRTGWLGEFRYGLLNDIRHLDKQQFPLMIERFMALADPENQCPSYYPKPTLTPSSLNKEWISTDEKWISLCPGAAYGPAKRWPVDNFARVAEILYAQGYRLCILGSKNESDLAKEIVSKSQVPLLNLCGKTSLLDVIGILKQSLAAVTNDSGLMHIASAVKTPLLAIFGSSSPDFTPPLTEKKKIFQSKMTCAPCFKRDCQYQHYQCLRETTPKNVIDALEELME